MFFIESQLQAESLKRTEARDKRLLRYLQQEIEDALSAKSGFDAMILEALRQYEGVPKVPYRSTPIEDSPNIEITLGAIAVDSLYAQAMTSIWSVSPILTCAATRDDPKLVKAVDRLQFFANWGVENEFNTRKCAEHVVMDVIQLGTGAIQTSYINLIRKTQTTRIVDRGPRNEPIPIEHLILPGGYTGEPNMAPWIAVRMYLSHEEVRARARLPEDRRERWELDKRTLKPFMPCANVAEVTQQRESMSRTTSNAKLRKLYEVYAVYVSFDYDDDGEDEELLCFWDRTSNTLGWCNYSRNDYRPINKEVYQVRAHMWNGLGVMEMMRPYQEEVSHSHNQRATNVELANFRVWAVKEGYVNESVLTGIKNRVIPLANPRDDMVPLSMGEVYTSESTYEITTLNLGERRVGLADTGGPRASQAIGTRTPATTAAALMQSGSNRFAPAFDNIRRLIAGGVQQCLWRYHEQLRAESEGGPAERNIKAVLGEEDGQLVVDLLKESDFLQSVSVELTASNASINRDADRQNSIMLANFLGAWGEKILQLITITSNTQVPQEVREVAKKLAIAAGSIAERTVRTFDQIRDPSRYIVDIEGELNQAVQSPPGPLQGLMQLLGANQQQPLDIPGQPA